MEGVRKAGITKTATDEPDRRKRALGFQSVDNDPGRVLAYTMLATSR